MGSQSRRATLTALLATALLAGSAQVWCAAAVSEVSLKNPSFEDAVRPNGLPGGWSLYAGGKALRLSLVETADTGRDGRLFRRAIDEGVLYVPGAYCYPNDPTRTIPTNTLRLSFGVPTIDEIRTGVARLALAIHRER